MEENKTDGRTAMERLARELMDKIESSAETSWCRDHGYNVKGTSYTEDKRNARADIERRINEADLEDDRARDVALGDWKAKSDAMDETCRVLGVDSYNLAADAARSLVDEHCELKELREAGRVVPEGCRWPSFGDGGRLALGGEAWTKDGGRVRVVAVSHRGRAAVRPWGRKDGRGARWVPLSSLLGECPDSWARLREDARKDYTAYWGCIGFCCDKCPALVDGKKPSERYDTAGCHTAEQIDLLARAERLAGVQGE